MKKNLFIMIDLIKKQNRWLLAGSIACSLASLSVNAQQNADSLRLNDAIALVIQTHPTVKQAQQALVVADARIGLAKSGYLPHITADGNYSHMGPVPSISMPGLGTFDMAAADNYDASVNYSHTVYDFGKTGKEVSLARETKNLSQLSIEQLKQRLAMNVVSGFYTLLYLQDAIDIKHEQLATLQKHLEYVQKKKDTGSATQYEVLSTQVRISAVQSQLTDLETARKDQASALNVLMGLAPENQLVVKKELGLLATPVVSIDSLMQYALTNRDEMKLVRERANVAQLNYSNTQAQNNPTVNVFASGGYKNGYFPDLTEPKLNYVVGLGIRVPLYDANHKKENMVIAQSAIESNRYEADIVSRDISVEVVSAQNQLLSELEKLKQCELQLLQAQQALQLAQTSFKNGAVTNLDLLNATNVVSESELWLLRSRVDYLTDLYKLKRAIGDRLY